MKSKEACRRLSILLYKNFLYRLRGKTLLILELCLPLLFLIFFIVFKNLASKTFDKLIQNLVPMSIVLGIICPILTIVRALVAEKEAGFKELLRIMGIPKWLQWLGWFLNMLIFLLLNLFIVWLSVGVIALPNSNKLIVAMALLLYALATTGYAFLVAAIFPHYIMAMCVGALGSIVVNFAEYSLVANGDYRGMNLASRLTLCFLPNFALNRILSIMVRFEFNLHKGGSGEMIRGVSWTDFSERPPSNDDNRNEGTELLTIGHIFLMMFISFVVQMLVAYYLDDVLPADFGVRKPFYYLCQPSNYRKSSRKQMGKLFPAPAPPSSNAAKLSRAGSGGHPSDESPPTGLEPGVVMINLKKVYQGGKVAVDGVTLDLFNGQITVLLGHNGAGKSSLISMLTGITAATSGTALINGHDLNTDLDGVRQSLGLCPQHNMLFPELSLQHHLTFMGRLRGLSRKEARDGAHEMIEKLNLTGKEKSSPMKLSGGQKRKLQLGMALMGGARVIVLDEPTSGMDVKVRRAVWDLLMEARKKRTILLTTHDMEEADVLGDRIALMVDGQIRCSGTPFFLKKLYGTGYTLHINMTHDPTTTTTTVEGTDETRDLTGGPSPPAENSDEADLPHRRHSSKRSLKKLKGRKSLHKHSSQEQPEKGRRRSSSYTENLMSILVRRHLQNATLVKEQRSEKIVQIRIPIDDNPQSKFPALFREIYERQGDLGIRSVGLSFTTMDDVFSLAGGGAIEKQNRGETKMGLAREIQSQANQKTVVVDPSVSLASGSIKGKKLYLSQFWALILKKFYYTLRQKKLLLFQVCIPILMMIFAILSFNTLFGNALKKHIIYEKDGEMFGWLIGTLFSMIIFVGVNFPFACALLPPLEERLSMAKQLQIMSGVSPLMYWATMLIWDMFMVTIMTCLMLICFPIFQKYPIFLVDGGGGVFLLLVMAHGFSAICCYYWISLVFQDAAGAFAFCYTFPMHLGPSHALYLPFFEMIPALTGASFVASFPRLFAAYSGSRGMVKFVQIAIGNGRCIVAKKNRTICDHKKYPKTPWLKWKEPPITVGAVEEPGIGQYLLDLILMGIFFLIIITLMEYKVCGRICRRKDKNLDKKEEKLMDEDVKMEANRIDQLVTSGNLAGDTIAVHRFRKNFGKLEAVKSISFGVHQAECFGLLGVNGAGKTTFFKTLTGDLAQNGGDAYIWKPIEEVKGDQNNFISLKNERWKFLKSIGYCPQFDGIISVFTGRQNLELFCRLRGHHPTSVKGEVEHWLDRLGLTDSGNVQCSKYSGGMKRKLTTGVALIGQPSICLLDEPSSGVDPIGRRKFWEILSHSKALGQASILTSHSMEECESVCSRIGIMVNGQLDCLGDAEYLKNKFAQGCSLTIKMKFGSSGESFLKSLTELITQNFPPSIMLDVNETIIQYQLLNKELRWDAIFSKMEFLVSAEHSLIEDYYVSETTLDQVFLMRVKEQRVTDEKGKSCCC